MSDPNTAFRRYRIHAELEDVRRKSVRWVADHSETIRDDVGDGA